MKGTFFSADFIKTSSGIKFLELNTDTIGMFGATSDNQLDWSGFIELIQSESIDTVAVIYKPIIQRDIVTNLSQSLHSSASFITTFDEYEENVDAIYPTAVEDGANKFILRLAYDENAIVDSTYAKHDVNSLALFNEYTASDDAIPFYTSGSDLSVDTLIRTTNDGVYPDLVKKSLLSTSTVSFVKVAGELVDGNYETGSEYANNRINNFISSSDIFEDYYVQNFLYDTGSISEGKLTSIRHYGIVYGTSLTHLPLATLSGTSLLSVPNHSDISFDLSNDFSYPTKHYYEFSTSTIKKNISKRGVYETEKIVSSSNELIDISNVPSGSILKSYYIPGVTDDEDLTTHYINITVDGSTLPSGSQITSSVMVGSPSKVDMWDSLISEVKISGSLESNFFSTDIITFIYESSSNQFKYKRVLDINKDDDYFIDINSNKLAIETASVHILNVNTGSFYELDVETEDNFIISNDISASNESMYSIILHNAKFY